MSQIIKLFIPPIFLSIYRKLRSNHRSAVHGSNIEVPQWCTFTAGQLKGRPFLCNPHVEEYQSMMLAGTFDEELFEQVDESDWSGKVIYDIGSHVGYHVMNFADRVGSKGKVFSFEPHPLHRERISKNLERNEDLQERVTIIPVAVGNKMGRTNFYYTSAIEGSSSSMSFIEDASTPFHRSFYSNFMKSDVDLATIDMLIDQGICPPPDLIKIDVEGAEGLVVEGALKTLAKYKPVILMEIHSFDNMLVVAGLLPKEKFKIQILKDEERRCFVKIQPAV